MYVLLLVIHVFAVSCLVLNKRCTLKNTQLFDFIFIYKVDIGIQHILYKILHSQLCSLFHFHFF